MNTALHAANSGAVTVVDKFRIERDGLFARIDDAVAFACTATINGYFSNIYGYSNTGTGAKNGRSLTHGRRDTVKKSLEELNQHLAPVTMKALAEAEPPPPPKATFTISARGKNPDMPVLAFLREGYGTVPLREIDSLFGFAERSTLYGGRVFSRRELSERDIFQLNSAGIGIRLPLSNHYV